jgi:CheY-like chemotaxis protein
MARSENPFFLLADDDRDDAELFGEAVASLHVPIEFQHVEDGRAGRAVFDFLSDSANRNPDLIFLDLNMPQVSGWQCLAKLKNDIYFQKIPVIMYSTSSHPRDKEIALDLGALGFITKPSDFKLLQKILGNIASNLDGDLKKIIKDGHYGHH